MENELFKMFRHVNMGGGDSYSLLRELIYQYERGVLLELQKQINGRLRELSSETHDQHQSNMYDDDMNPFTVLGVNMTATEDEVKAAYKEKAWEAHPDHGGNNEQMVKVNAAYDVIKRFKGWV